MHSRPNVLIVSLILIFLIGCTGKATTLPATGSTVAGSASEQQTTTDSIQSTQGSESSTPSSVISSSGASSEQSTTSPSGSVARPTGSSSIPAVPSTSIPSVTSSANPARYSAILQLLVELRTHHVNKDTLKQSIAITDINTIVTSLGAQPVKEAWESLALCIASACPDERFLEFARTVVIDGSSHGMPNGPLALNLLVANKYWNTDNTIAFSEAVSAADTAITALSKPDLTKNWQEFVACKGKCNDKNQILFNILRALS